MMNVTTTMTMKTRNMGFKMMDQHRQDNQVALLRRGKAFSLCLAIIALVGFSSGPAQAYYCVADQPNAAQTVQIVNQVNSNTDARARDIMDHVTTEFQNHQTWMIETYFKEHILPAMQLMAEQLTSVAMLQMEIVGSFFDAKHQLETQRLYQELAAQAHKDYSPSEGLCTIGTTMRSLAASDRNGDLTALVLAKHSIDRQLLNANSNASEGPKEDLEGRVAQFRRVYCEKNDNNGDLEPVCDDSVTQERKNKDIDYSRTIASPLTLDLDFSNGGTPTADEEDILALSANLYAHDIFSQIPQAILENKEGNQQVYLAARSIVAKRSVAENSFQAIAGMKARGATPDAQTAQYLEAVMAELGVSNADARRLIGENPSYYAQMEVLTKTLLQRPSFFVDLYDKPANVARKGVALQAIALMQDRDSFKSTLRSEAMLSIILELQLMRAQEKVQNEINRLK